jgi:hypothetical protein
VCRCLTGFAERHLSDLKYFSGLNCHTRKYFSLINQMPNCSGGQLYVELKQVRLTTSGSYFEL